MRTTLAALAVVAAASPAAAQPVTTASPCEVRFVRAPDDVREVIETWLQAEPRCSNAVDVRVIPTDEGYYVMAQRPDGRIHERVVPDAQSAGVLVASWAADDWVAPRQQPVVAPTPFPVVQPVSTPVDALAFNAPAAPRRRGPSKWLSAGVIRNPHDANDDGLRAEIDLFARGSWGLGAALVYAEGTLEVSAGIARGRINSTDISVLGYASYTLGRDRWQLRLALGAGVGEGEVEGNVPAGGDAQKYIHASGRALYVESSALLTRRFGAGWGITIGPTLTIIDQQSTTDDGMPFLRRDGQLRIFAGLRRQL